MMKRLPCTMFFVVAFFTCFSCEKNPTESTEKVPVVTTAEVSDITSTSATCGGTITSDGGSTVTARGVCWSTGQTPTVSDDKTNDGTGASSFTSNITGLTPETTYYVRAYAINSVGTSYGNEISFTTSPVIVTGITLNLTSTEIVRGSSKQLTATISPFNATNKNVKWSSSNNSIATVDNGLVSGVSVGSVTITATTEDGSFAANCQVNVTPIIVTGITLNASSVSLLENETYQLAATVMPTNADNKNVTWSSSNPNVATVNSDGVVTAITIGSVEIKATSVDGNFTATCSISVVPITEKIILFFGGSCAIINGWVIGTVYSYILNNSSYAITLTKFEIIDSNTNTVKVRSTDVNQLGILEAGETKNLGANINIYKPIFKWYFTYNGNSYTVQHQKG